MEFLRTMAVASVEVRPWSVSDPSPWTWKRRVVDPVHGYCPTPPQDQTAGFIVRDLSSLNDDLKAGFIIEASCRSNQFYHFASNVIWEMNRHYQRVETGWWSATARHVCPPTRLSGWIDPPKTAREQARRWRDIVRRAVVEWNALADEWVVVRVPDLMDRDSEEYAAYRKWADYQTDLHERATYERLRPKFER